MIFHHRTIQCSKMKKMKNAQLRKLKIHEESLKALQDFTDESNWDEFYTIRGINDSYDWYADWPELKVLLTENLLRKSPEHPELQQPENARILVPACGNSSLSGHLYDFGFQSVLNLDFSKVVISNMMRKNLRERPAMKWRVRDITDLKLPRESIDAVVDKGGLDCLMECIPDNRLGGDYYLSEVKTVLAAGGKFICITLAESHVIDLLLCKFRFGWKTSLHTIAQDGHPEHQIFAFVAEKDSPTSISELSSFLDKLSVESHGDEARELLEALDKERAIRAQYETGRDVVYSLEDLVSGAKGNISELEPGRRIELLLDDPRVSYMTYRAILLDSKESEGFEHQYGVVIVPYLGARNSPLEKEERQWGSVINAKTTRLLMVLLDSSNFICSYPEIKEDLDCLIGHLKPAHYDTTIEIPYLYSSDGIRKRKHVYQVTSDLTGDILVEDVTYLATDEDGICDGDHHRRLIFLRTKNLVQSEAVLAKEAPSEAVKEAPKRKKKGKQRKYKSGSSSSFTAGGRMEVVHNILYSEYHNRIFSGMLLISAYFLQFTSYKEELVKAVVIGLGAGLFPMFMKMCLSSLKIEVVELDPVVLDVARKCFGFEEDEWLKVHIGDGIEFVKEMAEAGKVADTSCKNKQVIEEESSRKVDMLVVDVDSTDLSSDLTCPNAKFVDESFLRAAKESLSEKGVLIMNLITRSSTTRAAVHSRLKTVFRNILRCYIQEDVYEVIFALKTDSVLTEEQLSEACNIIPERLEEQDEEWTKAMFHLAQSIKLLR